MKRMTKLALSALCFMALSACSEKDDQAKTSDAASQNIKSAWKDYSFADGAFSIKVPVDPVCQEQDAGNGIKAHLCTTESDSTGILITYAEIPAKGKLPANKLEEIYKSSMDGAAKNVQGELASSEDVTVNGVTGKNYVIKTKDGSLKNRIFVHKGYLVTVGAMPKASPEAAAEEIEKALSSFGPKA